MPSKAAIIHKVYNAPVSSVFDAWTKAEHLNHWMFPMPGCQCEFVSADIRDGGASLHKITMPNGHEMWLYSQYEEVRTPQKLVFLQYMSNENGDIIANPNMPDWPKDMVATLTFEAVDDENSTLNFEWAPRDPSDAELTTFNAAGDQAMGGWNASLSNLEKYLASS